jgi:hypothetical protein
MRFEISTDPSRLDRELIYRFLHQDAYWCRGISRERVEIALEHSGASARSMTRLKSGSPALLVTTPRSPISATSSSLHPTVAVGSAKVW